MVEEVLLLSRETARKVAMLRIIDASSLNVPLPAVTKALHELRLGRAPIRTQIEAARRLFGPELFDQAKKNGFSSRDLAMAFYQLEMDARTGGSLDVAPSVEESCGP